MTGMNRQHPLASRFDHMPSLKIHTWLVGLAILYTVFPILIALLGVGLARLFNCTNAGLEYTCGISGLGDVITLMVFAHWLGLFTLPTGGFLSIIGALSLLGRLVWRWLR